jgi:hypothetical protein
MVLMDIEAVRRSYKPEKIRLLLVGESPPASGEFFYLKSNMTIYTSKAFEQVFLRTFHDIVSFLRFFRQIGCYLDDLCLTPVDKMPTLERKALLEESVGPLSERLKKFNPEAIAIVLKRIVLHVQQAIEMAGLTCPVYTLPFAGMGHQNKYIEELSEILKIYDVRQI